MKLGSSPFFVQYNRRPMTSSLVTLIIRSDVQNAELQRKYNQLKSVRSLHGVKFGII